jgi:hypothetical protein
MRAKLTRADRDRILERGVKIAESSLPSWLTELALSTAYADKTDFTEHVADFTEHVGNTANPHAVTKAQVGLGNADNTSDADKPISTATATALAGKSNTGHGHTFADISGQVSSAQLPPLAINETFPVANQAAMLALTAQRGDIAIRSDNGRTYVLATDSPSTLADWKEVMAAGQVQSVAGKTGVVSLVKADVGLGNIDNTSDVNKPVSTAQAAADALLAKGLVAFTEQTSNSGAIGSQTVVLNIPSFTFKANRRYRVTVSGNYYSSGTSSTGQFAIHTCPTADSAASVANLTTIKATADKPNAASEGRQVILIRDGLTYSSDTTLQLKYTMQRITGSDGYFSQASANDPLTLAIHDDGANL